MRETASNHETGSNPPAGAEDTRVQPDAGWKRPRLPLSILCAVVTVILPHAG